MRVLTHRLIKKNSFALFLTILLFSSVYSQDDLPEFGKVDVADLQMQDCPFDKGADAMNLVSYEKATIAVTSAGYYTDIEKWVRIKIFTLRGFQYATVKIPYISNNGELRVTDIAARTYNLDNKGNIETPYDRKGRHL